MKLAEAKGIREQQISDWEVGIVVPDKNKYITQLYTF
jgi:hypothetical protein